jgi:hypothetical protein
VIPNPYATQEDTHGSGHALPEDAMLLAASGISDVPLKAAGGGRGNGRKGKTVSSGKGGSALTEDGGETAEPEDGVPLSEKFAGMYTETVTVTENTYSSPDISITVTQEQLGRTTYYLADIYLRDITCFQSALARNTYGSGYRDSIADMAALTAGEALYDNADFGNMEYSAEVQAVIAQYSAPIMGINGMTARLYDVEEAALTQEMADAITAIRHVDAGDPPFYIEAGSADSTIDYNDSVALYDALVAAGVENCVLHIYEGMEHSTAWFQSEQVTDSFLNWLDAIFER